MLLILVELCLYPLEIQPYFILLQSIIPGILQGDKSDSLLYGSVDNGKKICWDEKFHLKVVSSERYLILFFLDLIDNCAVAIILI